MLLVVNLANLSYFVTIFHSKVRYNAADQISFSCTNLMWLIVCLDVEVFTEYFKELEEESIRDNFVLIYELMDEMIDFGYPQTTDSKILQE